MSMFHSLTNSLGSKAEAYGFISVYMSFEVAVFVKQRMRIALSKVCLKFNHGG